MLDEGVKPIIISDADFYSSWFEAVQGLGWDYVGRIRGNKYYRYKSKKTGRKAICWVLESRVP